jgi:hypothetical protein
MNLKLQLYKKSESMKNIIITAILINCICIYGKFPGGTNEP